MIHYDSLLLTTINHHDHDGTSQPGEDNLLGLDEATVSLHKCLGLPGYRDLARNMAIEIVDLPRFTHEKW